MQLCGICFDCITMLITVVIHHEAYRNLRILFFNEIEQTDAGECVDILGSSDVCELLIVAIDCTEDIASLSSR